MNKDPLNLLKPKSLNLKFLSLNCENLFLLFDQEPNKPVGELSQNEWNKLSTSLYPIKDLTKTLALAEEILRQDPDIVLLSEVGGSESLKNFNKHFLNNQYWCALIEGNSDRNIDVGYLIHKRCPFHFDLYSHKEHPIELTYLHEKYQETHDENLNGVKKKPYRFSRDAAELHLFTQDREKPFMIILLTHLKSPLDPEGIDPGGFVRRSAELKALLDIYLQTEKEHPNIPIMIAGDFNGIAALQNTDEEFKPLYEKTRLLDVLELAKIDPAERHTYVHVKPLGQTEARQIDYAFLNPVAQAGFLSESAQVIRFRNELGERPLMPSNLEEKLGLPSDHYPLVFQIRVSF